jgi:hypothetical protein
VRDLVWIDFWLYLWDEFERDDSTKARYYLDTLSKIWPGKSEIIEIWLLIAPLSKTDNSISQKNKSDSRLRTANRWKQNLLISCDSKKIAKIIEKSLQKIEPTWSNYSWLQNPCSNFMIPNLLSFVNWYYIWDRKTAYQMSLITRLHDWVPWSLIDLWEKIAQNFFDENRNEYIK